MANLSLSQVRRQFNSEERKILLELNSPKKIQDFLDKLDYNVGDEGHEYSSPRKVLQLGSADCFEGAIFASAALRFHGERPLIYYISAVKGDLDHVISLYRKDEFWGGIAKSRYVGLTFREPIHRDLRELTTSYFESYFNPKMKKTIRGYSMPVNLSRFDSLDWMTSEKPLKFIEDHLNDRFYTVFFENGAQFLREATPIMKESQEVWMKQKGILDRIKKHEGS